MQTSPKLLMVIVGLTLIVRTSHGAARPPGAPVPAVSVDAVTAIVAAYHSHSIVTLPDWHGDQRLLEFILTLLRDPRLPTVVDDIVPKEEWRVLPMEEQFDAVLYLGPAR